MLRYFFLFTFFVSLPFCVFASSTSGGTLLKQFAGGRPASMSEAYTAVSDDLYGLHYNPSGMVNSKQDFTVMYFKEPDIGFNYGLISYGRKFGELGFLAADMYMYDAGVIDWEDENGNASTLNIQRDYLFTFGYSKKLSEYFSAGINTKLFSSTLIEKYNATAIGIDIGCLYTTPVNGLKVGTVVQNVGTPIKYIEVADPMPTTFRAGMSYKLNMPTKTTLIVDVDIVKSNDNDTKKNIGFDYWVSDLLSLRGGYKIGYDLENYSFGFGVRLNTFQIDYGIISRMDSGFVHIISVNLGKVVKEFLPTAPPSISVVVRQSKKEKIKLLVNDVDNLCKKGMYLDALSKVSELLEISSDGRWQKLETQLKKITGLIQSDTESGNTHDLIRKSVYAYLGRQYDERIAILILRYARQLYKENQTVPELLQFMEDEYPDVAKREVVTEGQLIVAQKLTLALDYIYNGKYNQAIAECDDVLILEPDNDMALKRAGSAYFALGNKTMARKMWQQAKRVNPHDPTINEFLRKTK